MKVVFFFTFTCNSLSLFLSTFWTALSQTGSVRCPGNGHRRDKKVINCVILTSFVTSFMLLFYKQDLVVYSETHSFLYFQPPSVTNSSDQNFKQNVNGEDQLIGWDAQTATPDHKGDEKVFGYTCIILSWVWW